MLRDDAVTGFENGLTFAPECSQSDLNYNTSRQPPAASRQPPAASRQRPAASRQRPVSPYIDHCQIRAIIASSNFKYRRSVPGVPAKCRALTSIESYFG